MNSCRKSAAPLTVLRMLLVIVLVGVWLLWSGNEFIKAYRGKLDASVSTAAPRWLERSEAATTFGISLETLDSVRKTGNVRSKRADDQIIVEVASLESWVESLDDA